VLLLVPGNVSWYSCKVSWFNDFNNFWRFLDV